MQTEISEVILDAENAALSRGMEFRQTPDIDEAGERAGHVRMILTLFHHVGEDDRQLHSVFPRQDPARLALQGDGPFLANEQ